MSRAIIITGASRGIGRYLAEHYLAAGCPVAGCSRGAPTIHHPNYTHFSLNVSDEAAVVGMVRDVAKKCDGVRALLNNAGIASMNAMATTPVCSARALFETNFLGTFAFTREVSKAMMRAREGRIVNFTTVAVPLRLEGEAVYAASKAAIETFTRITARELGGFNITVNAIGPTPVETDLIKTVPKAKIDALLARQAMRRLGTFSDVANVTDFFLAPSSEFVTGQVLYLGGIG